MSTVQTAVSDMLITVKSRELQRGLQASMAGRAGNAKQHFLAAAHLELVLAQDYEQAGDPDMAIRSRISAASSFWRAGNRDQARELFTNIACDDPRQSREIDELMKQLEA